jgi:hypothetical protein
MASNRSASRLCNFSLVQLFFYAFGDQGALPLGTPSRKTIPVKGGSGGIIPPDGVVQEGQSPSWPPEAY